MEVLYIANKRKYKINKIPVVFSHSGGSKIRLIHDSWEMFMDIIRIKKNDDQEIYD